MSPTPHIARSRIADLWRHTGGRVVLLLVAIVLVVNVGALLAIAFDNFDDYPDATWWAITHVLDPGTLSDDTAWDERVIGLFLTVVGLVVLLGIVLAVLTDVVQGSLRHLDDAPGHLPDRAHVVVCGWSTALPTMLDALAQMLDGADSEAKHPVVVIAPRTPSNDRSSMESELRRRRGALHPRLVFGDDTAPDVLETVHVRSARAVLVLPDDREPRDPSALDLQTISRATAVARSIDGAATRPAVIVLLGRERSIDVATDALPRDFVTLVTDRLTTGTIKLALASPPWSRALLEDLSDPAGTILRMLGGARVEGRRFDAVTDAVSDALPLGVRRADGTFDTRPATVVGAGDQVVALDAPGATFPREATFTATAPVPSAAQVRALVIGWNHRVPTLVADLAATSGTRYVVTNLSDVDAGLRRSEIDEGAMHATECTLVTGSVDDPAVLEHVAHDSEPAGIVVTSTLLAPVRDPAIELAAADAQAVLAALALVRGATRSGTPVLLDLFLPRDHGVAALAAGPGVVATHELTASTVAAFAYDPALATAMMAIFADDDAPPVVEPFTPDDHQPHAFGDAYRALLDAGRVLVGYTGDDGDPVLAPPSDRSIPPGTTLLVLDTSGARRP